MGMGMTDDRVTLPLIKTRAAAELLCGIICPSGPWFGEPREGGHHAACLIPDLAERDLAMATTYLATSISSFCLLPASHHCCSGCACHHHTLKTGRMRK